ncbi:MAG: hypothetical protein HYR95_01305 [Candidatus Colwellbacteria bacterium]|nr:hypothetical protein [Candidatus Colwellbacteria bacterium]
MDKKVFTLVGVGAVALFLIVAGALFLTRSVDVTQTYAPNNNPAPDSDMMKAIPVETNEAAPEDTTGAIDKELQGVDVNDLEAEFQSIDSDIKGL